MGRNTAAAEKVEAVERKRLVAVLKLISTMAQYRSVTRSKHLRKLRVIRDLAATEIRLLERKAG